MGFIDTAVDWVLDKLSGLMDSVVGAILKAISDFVGMLMYYITWALMQFVNILQKLFDVFSGTTKVSYKGDYHYLTSVFFQSRSINGIYWGMALLGITFVIVFTFIAVIRKSFDINDKKQNQSMGSILGAMFKSIFTMLVLSLVMSAVLNITNLVINRIGYIFDNAESFTQVNEMEFTDEQFATMARIYKTIGNYSLNPSYNSHYNLNSCYNDIRQDLASLENEHVFDMVYITKENGKTVDTWQSLLQELDFAANPSRELNMDQNYDSVNTILLKIMNILKTNSNFFPLERYQADYTTVNSISMDRILFLSGTISAAKNQAYNENPYMTDGLRGPFYTGEKSIYDFDQVKQCFETGCFGGIAYIFIWILTYFTIRNLLRCIFGCIMRIFNMVSLYVVAPLAIAPMPLDEGEKFKQWTLAMTIQAMSILGTLIPMRLILIFAPIILSPDLKLFPDSTVLNLVAKVLMIVGGLEAVEGFGGMVTGILANNVSMQALNSEKTANSLADRAFSPIGTAMRKAPGVAGKFAGYTVGGAVLGAAVLGGAAVVGSAAAVGGGLYYGGKGIINGISNLRSNLSDKAASGGVSSTLPSLNSSIGSSIDSSGSGSSIPLPSMSNLGGSSGGSSGGIKVPPPAE